MQKQRSAHELLKTVRLNLTFRETLYINHPHLRAKASGRRQRREERRAEARSAAPYRLGPRGLLDFRGACLPAAFLLLHAQTGLCERDVFHTRTTIEYEKPLLGNTIGCCAGKWLSGHWFIRFASLWAVATTSRFSFPRLCEYPAIKAEHGRLRSKSFDSFLFVST